MVHLSIILPCYNVEKYIAECLDSLYAQDIPETEYEVICVNDCSPDGTRAIIVEYQKLHKNLLLIDHEVNKRQGGARNTGLMAAKGEYVWFVDPDDYVEKNILKKLLYEVEKSNLDILLFDYQKVSEVGEIVNMSNFQYTSEVQIGKNIFKKEAFWDITSLCWIRFVRKKMLEKNDVSFFEKFHYEDVIFGIKCFLFASRFRYISVMGYNYRNNPTSDMNTLDGGEKLSSMIKLAQQYYEIALNIKDDNELSDILSSIAIFYLHSVFKPIIYLSTKERLIFYKYISKIEELDLLKNICSVKMKIVLFLPTISRITLFIITPIITKFKRMKEICIKLR